MPSPTRYAPIASHANWRARVASIVFIAGRRGAGRARDRFGFLDQHDRNVVAHGVLQSARVADQAVLLVVEMQVALAFRARQDVEQFLTQRHRGNPPSTLLSLMRPPQ